MSSRRLTIVALVVAAVVAGVWLVRYLSAEQVIRRQIDAAVSAFEGERLLGVAAVLSRSYHDEWGMSYETVLGHVQEVMDSFSGLEVELEPPVVEVDGEEARVSLRLVVWGTADGERGFVVGSPERPVATTQLWRKEPPGWRLSTTETLDIPELRDELDAMRSRERR
jgi:hypothetical protein